MHTPPPYRPTLIERLEDLASTGTTATTEEETFTKHSATLDNGMTATPLSPHIAALLRPPPTPPPAWTDWSWVEITKRDFSDLEIISLSSGRSLTPLPFANTANCTVPLPIVDVPPNPTPPEDQDGYKTCSSSSTTAMCGSDTSSEPGLRKRRKQKNRKKLEGKATWKWWVWGVEIWEGNDGCRFIIKLFGAFVAAGVGGYIIIKLGHKKLLPQ
ncbi:hypothetical protein SpCBS45565_g08006 [Spizellomyces sp. 'palustris']|nr:hypothetical protein SpCBS45565_g08006 [Spizellomyces sp. 'palustris']